MPRSSLKRIRTDSFRLKSKANNIICYQNSFTIKNRKKRWLDSMKSTLGEIGKWGLLAIATGQTGILLKRWFIDRKSKAEMISEKIMETFDDKIGYLFDYFKF